ncbi:hypothetical protein [Pseudomonas baetica]|uniref:hypothetical protein n=1 Tax=Pseudomonas baetica TaxID=674054 RepID=UPI00240604EE|nr:hypothetical protein [Pseudomonas baetica]MDF9779003.1 hypothetical protein [Pseudomonas baetica]
MPTPKIGDKPVPGIVSAPAINPITDTDEYRVVLEACVEAEGSEDLKLARTLRALVDASPFGGCPMCDGRPTWRNEPACVACNGDGFVPDSISTPFLAGQAARLKGVDLRNASIQLLAPFGRAFNDFMAGYNSDPAAAKPNPCAQSLQNTPSREKNDA